MKDFEKYEEELLQHRRYFHMYPELGLQEEKDIGIYQNLSGKTGV